MCTLRQAVGQPCWAPVDTDPHGPAEVHRKAQPAMQSCVCTARIDDQNCVRPWDWQRKSSTASWRGPMQTWPCRTVPGARAPVISAAEVQRLPRLRMQSCLGSERRAVRPRLRRRAKAASQVNASERPRLREFNGGSRAPDASCSLPGTGGTRRFVPARRSRAVSRCRRPPLPWVEGQRPGLRHGHRMRRMAAFRLGRSLMQKPLADSRGLQTIPPRPYAVGGTARHGLQKQCPVG